MVATPLQHYFIASAVSWKFIIDRALVGLKSEIFYSFGLGGLRGRAKFLNEYNKQLNKYSVLALYLLKIFTRFT
jgi:hypothetical protein